MNELLAKPKGTPGRQRTVTAKAWISRDKAGSIFRSKVSLGDGIVHVLSTSTARRDKALDFNRCHLLSRLSATTAMPAQAPASQALLPTLT